MMKAINHDLRSRLMNYLDRDETTLWIGQPNRGISFSKADWFLIPFGILFTGFTVFWMIMAFFLTSEEGPVALGFFGIPFILIGFYIVFGRHLMDAAKRKKQIYAITEKRVLILEQGSGTLHSYPLEQLKDLSYTQKSDRSGTIFLGSPDPRFKMLEGTNWPGVKNPPSLVGIQDVCSVFDILNEARKRN